jgi:hypothetical protein
MFVSSFDLSQSFNYAPNFFCKNGSNQRSIVSVYRLTINACVNLPIGTQIAGHVTAQVKRPSFCTVGLLPVLSGKDVPGHDEPGPRPRHLGHLRAGEGLQGIQSHEIRTF